ncbi:MAG: GHKL domain-containing protein [Lachnospiraceae bacterium]|nr:GHKL domain-containing protein [Lachnospiraceae bacterium]
MNMITVVTGTAGAIFKCLFFYALWNLFSEGKSRRIPLIIMLIVSLVMEAVPTGNLPVTFLVNLIVIMPYTLFIERNNLLPALLSILLFWDIRSISYFFVNSATSHLSDRMLEGIETTSDIISFVDTRVTVMQIIIELLYISLCIVLYLPLKKIVKQKEEVTFWEFLYLAVPALSGVALTMVMTRISVIMIPDSAFILTDEKPELLWQLPLIAGLIYSAELSSVVMWQKSIDFRRQNELIAIQGAEKEALKRRLHDVESYYENVKRVRHEMAGHLVNIRGLAEYEEYDKLKDYIETLTETVHSVTLPVSTGSRVLDIVIGDKTAKAKEVGIRLEAKVFYQEAWGIQEYDIGIILGNLLDNALRELSLFESKKDQGVALETIEKGSVLFIRCENPCREDNLKDREDKRDSSEWHGFGLLNVRDIAERYGGGIRIERREETFSSISQSFP